MSKRQQLLMLHLMRNVLKLLQRTVRTRAHELQNGDGGLL
jgi:hypothetical protein